jgi:NADP-reducing hydrogenase subunit HndB
MTTVKSFEDLKRIREEALLKREARATTGRAQIVVGMGTCGIAAGARDTMKTILDEIEQQNLSGMVVTQTGCIGKCEQEPIIEVTLSGGAKVTYRNVTPENARRILQEHVVDGKQVSELMIQG